MSARRMSPARLAVPDAIPHGCIVRDEWGDARHCDSPSKGGHCRNEHDLSTHILGDFQNVTRQVSWLMANGLAFPGGRRNYDLTDAGRAALARFKEEQPWER